LSRFSVWSIRGLLDGHANLAVSNENATSTVLVTSVVRSGEDGNDTSVVGETDTVGLLLMGAEDVLEAVAFAEHIDGLATEGLNIGTASVGSEAPLVDGAAGLGGV
jgi:hypothetical protein